MNITLLWAQSNDEAASEMNDRAVVVLASNLFIGLPWIVLIVMTFMIITAGRNYLRSGGDSNYLAMTRNRVIYGSASGISAGLLLGFIEVVYGPSLVEVVRGMGLSAAFCVATWAMLASTPGPTAVAVYSSWWMPRSERAAHREDVLYALTQAHWKRRSRHAWGLLKSSPRVGLRARRHHTRLAVEAASEPICPPSLSTNITPKGTTYAFLENRLIDPKRL
ncbi:hypothetical protein [Streptomyces cyaneofuscatus]|uniref:hypothetical protein n=1 Tax=Streptomyces cyaneofuscatus TaxID=66883 RepID=UPI003433A71E